MSLFRRRVMNSMLKQQNFLITDFQEGYTLADGTLKIPSVRNTFIADNYFDIGNKSLFMMRCSRADLSFTITDAIRVNFYDENKTFISRIIKTRCTPSVLEIPKNTKYVRVGYTLQNIIEDYPTELDMFNRAFVYLTD